MQNHFKDPLHSLHWRWGLHGLLLHAWLSHMWLLPVCWQHHEGPMFLACPTLLPCSCYPPPAALPASGTKFPCAQSVLKTELKSCLPLFVGCDSLGCSCRSEPVVGVLRNLVMTNYSIADSDSWLLQETAGIFVKVSYTWKPLLATLCI